MIIFVVENIFYVPITYQCGNLCVILRPMKRIVYFFSLLVVLSALYVALGPHVGADTLEVSAASAVDDDRDLGDDRLYVRTPLKERHEAVVDSRADNINAGTGRVKRVNPSFGSRAGGNALRTASGSIFLTVTWSKAGQACLMPMTGVVHSVRYYVIALRHIIR